MGLGEILSPQGRRRQEPLQRIARRVLADLADRTHQSAHLAVLHGRDVLYVVEERAPGRPPLVTDVGVRLPAQLTASGRAMLAALPAPQIKALFPDPGVFVLRTGIGPRSVSQTDHVSFDNAGIPAFQFMVDRLEYNSRTHHSNMDTFDRVQRDDMVQQATVIAVFAYNAAMRDEKLPRKALPAPQKGRNSEP